MIGRDAGLVIGASKMHRIPEVGCTHMTTVADNRQFAIISILKASARSILVDRSSIPITGDPDFDSQQTIKPVWANSNFVPNIMY